MKTLLALIALSFGLPAYGQVVIQSTYEPYEPIVVTVQLETAPTPDGKIRQNEVAWDVSSEKVRTEDGAIGTVYVWAPPGQHWIEADVVTLVIEERVIAGEKIRSLVSWERKRDKRPFVVTGSPAPVPPGPGPQPPGPTPFTPTAEMQQLVAPIKAVMAAGDATKAATWQEAWIDYLAALRASPPQTIGAFKAGAKAFTDAVGIKAGLQGAFPGFGTSVETAMVARFGNEDGPLDAARAAELIQAIAWACGRS